MKKYLSIAALVAIAFCAGFAAKPTPIGTPGRVRTDTVPPAQLLEEVEGLRQDNLGLRERLSGWEERGPRTITRTDTLVQPPDTVLTFVAMSGGGIISTPVLIVSDSVQMYRPELWRFDTSGCDDGWVVQSGSLICNRSRLGHLWLGLDSRVDYQSEGGKTALIGAIGAHWRPSYRSNWDAYLTIGTDSRLQMGVRKRWQLF